MTASSIEWTDRSDWNPIRGCTRVSPGCGGPGPQGGCYAEAIAARFSDPGQAFHGFAERTSKGPRWTGKVEVIEERLTLPLSWGKPAKVFVSSTSDIFHEALSDADIDRIFAVMMLAPHLTFQVLTKRSARMRDYLASPGERFSLWHRAISDQMLLAAPEIDASAERVRRIVELQALPNVWLGVSIEDQQRADERIPDLLATPAAVRFVSAEPLLGPVDLTWIEFPNERGGTECWDALDLHRSEDDDSPPFEVDATLDWVIVGGESGPNARPMHPDWARSLRDQCAAAGVAFHFKQWGEYAPVDHTLIPTPRERQAWVRKDGEKVVRAKTEADIAALEREENRAGEPLYSLMLNVGKKCAGRLLDGVEHNGLPA